MAAAEREAAKAPLDPSDLPPILSHRSWVVEASIGNKKMRQQNASLKDSCQSSQHITSTSHLGFARTRTCKDHALPTARGSASAPTPGTLSFGKEGRKLLGVMGVAINLSRLLLSEGSPAGPHQYRPGPCDMCGLPSWGTRASKNKKKKLVLAFDGDWLAPTRFPLLQTKIEQQAYCREGQDTKGAS